VAGQFNGWNKTSTPLAPEGNGNWSVDAPGATDGQEYKLVVGDVWHIDPRAKHVTNSVGNGIITGADFPWQGHAFGTPPWHELVIYEMHVGTFPDNPVQSGDLLDAIIHDMWYLQELGVNAIELLPSQEFPTDTSWGYNPAHIFAVESAYGGPAALKRFVDAAHAHGLAVILDVVYNHLGPMTSLCGNLTAGFSAGTGRRWGVSTFTMTGGPIRTGATRTGRIMAAPKSASSSGITS